ncbi:hypothetical protein OJ253_2812 [Cryptosporidium canis]|uniref:Uncharacterized protein n=1 Tax=Cryptosporidium canis TaxID=195482 RepID=A0A9D5HWF6_9CRYT|nr:hypothetical protein OJ253_2812 [Cryptosporidium canis]
MDSAEILFCLLDSLDNCDLVTEASVYSTVVDFAKSTTDSSNCVGLVSNAITSFLQVSHTSVNHQLSLLRLLSLIFSSYAISGDAVLSKSEGDVNGIGIINSTNFSINNDISPEDKEFFEGLTRFVLNEYIFLKNNDPRRVALLQVIVSLVFLIPDKLVDILLLVAEESRTNNSGGGISSTLVAISAISKIFPEVVCRKGHDIIVELLSLLHKAAGGDSGSKNSTSCISKVELVRCLADVADALRSSSIERNAFAGLIGTAFDALLNDWVPAIQKDKDAFFLSFPTLETLGHLAQVIDDEQLKQHAPRLLSVYLQILNSLLSKKNKYFPTFVSAFSEPSKEINECEDLLQNNIYTIRWRQYHAVSASALTPLLNSKSETIAISLHYSILSGFKLFLDRCHNIFSGVFQDNDIINSLLNVLTQYCAIFHRLYAPALLPGYTAFSDTSDDAVIIEKEIFESKNGLRCLCWDIQAVKEIVTTHYELILCWKSLIRQDNTRDTVIRFLFDNIDIKSANRLSTMFILSSVIEDIPFEKVHMQDGTEIVVSENSTSPLGCLMFRLARTTLEQGLDYSIAFILCRIICELSQHRFLHIGATSGDNVYSDPDEISITTSENGVTEAGKMAAKFTNKTGNKNIWVSPSPSSAEMLTYFLRLLAVPEQKAKSEHLRHLQRQKTDYLKTIQGSEGSQIPLFYPPSLWDLRRNAQIILSEELTTLVPDLLWPLLIDAVNHLKLGSAMPTVCESLSKSCQNIYQRTTPEVFINAFQYQSTKYLTVCDPYKIFIWLCMYAHDPHVYNGVLAYWALQCLQWISPMIVPTPGCIWACIPSQRLKSLIEIADTIIFPINVKESQSFINNQAYLSPNSKQFMVSISNLSSKIDIDCWFPLVDECISHIFSGISATGSALSSPLNLVERKNLETSDVEISKELKSGGSAEIKGSDIVPDTIASLLIALFSACRDIRSDRVQKSSETPTELQRAGMYSLLGLLLREVSSSETPISEMPGKKNLKFLKGIVISSIFDGLLTPDIINSGDSSMPNAASISGGNLSGSQGKVYGELSKDLLSSSEIQIVRDLTRSFSDLQHFFHAIGINSTTLQKSCGRSIGYASSHQNHFVHISEYLLDLIRSDVANKRSGAFSFFGKSLAVVQAEQLRSTLIISLGHSVGEAPASLFNSATETVKKILQVLEVAIKEEKELQLQCSTLKSIQIAFQALSSSEVNPELTLSSRINSVLTRFHSGDGDSNHKSKGGLDQGDISLELFSSFRDRIFPYLLTIIVFSAGIELPPAPLNSMLLLKAASGMPYSTSSSISSQRIHTDPSGSYIRSMVRHRDISIGSFENLEFSHEDLGVIDTTINDYESQNRDISSSARLVRSSNSYSINEDAKFGPFNLTLSVLSVLSENPYIVSDSVNNGYSEAFYTTFDMSQNLSCAISTNLALKDVVSNFSYIKNKNNLGVRDNSFGESCGSIDTSSNRFKEGMIVGNRTDGSKKRVLPCNGSLERNMRFSEALNKQNNSLSGENSVEINGLASIDSIVNSSTSSTQLLSGTIHTFSNNVGASNQTKNSSNVNSTTGINPVSGSAVNVSNNGVVSGCTVNAINSGISTGNTSTANNGILSSSTSVPPCNNNNAGTGNSNSSTNSVVFNKLLLDALDASISLISFPSPLMPQHIPLVVSSCLTLLVTVSSRIQFRCLTGDDFSIFYKRNIDTLNLPAPSLNIIDGGYRLEEIMNIIEDTSVPSNNTDVSVFSVLDSLDRLYLSIYKSHMPSWAGLTHLLEGLLGLAATSASSVLRCICIHIVYCLLCEAPVVEIFHQSKFYQRPENGVLNPLNNRNHDGVLPKGTWASWMHCIALVLGRTCDSCLFVRLIAFECIKECMKRCIWTKKIDLTEISNIDFGTDENLMLYNSRVSLASSLSKVELVDNGNRNETRNNQVDMQKIRSDIQSLILPPTYLSLLYNLASHIPAYCLRPLCQHILPSFHDADKVTAHSSVETVRVLLSINTNILESESFACKIVSSLFEEIATIKDNGLQHFVYLLIRNVVSFRFQAAISEIFRKSIQPQRYINHIVTNSSLYGDFMENVIINSSGGQSSEWTTIDIPSDNVRDNTTNTKIPIVSTLRGGLRDMIHVIFVVDPIYSKSISYIGKDKALLLESFRYLTDVLNNTEQKYSEIIDTNEKLCIKIISSPNINISGTNYSFQASNNSASPSHNSVTNLIGTGLMAGSTFSMGITAGSGGNSTGSFSLANNSMFSFSVFSVFPSEHINIRSSTLALDILLQTNDSAIKIIAKKHFPELISTILLRCCSTLGYINMGALESSNALRSLFLALHDSDSILTYFDANQLKSSLIQPGEFDCAVTKLLCYLFVHNPDLTTSIISFVSPFLKRINSIYSMGALIIISSTPLGIYYRECSKIFDQTSSELSSDINTISEKEISDNIYSLDFLDGILNIIKTSNNPYSKKNGFIFFQWYFWYCLESNKYPSKEFLFRFVNVCFTCVIASSLIRSDANSEDKENLNPAGFRIEEFDHEHGECKNRFSQSKDFYKSEEYRSRNETDNEYPGYIKNSVQLGVDEDSDFSDTVHNDVDKDYTLSKSCSDLSDHIKDEFKHDDQNRDGFFDNLDETQTLINAKNGSVIAEYLRECLVSLRYMVSLISKISIGVPLQFVPEHPTIYLNYGDEERVTNISEERSSICLEFIELLFLFNEESSIEQRQSDSFQTVVFESEDLCRALVGRDRIADIFVDFITNIDVDPNITVQKMYLLLDILILLRQSWIERKPSVDEVERFRFSIKKLLVPLLIRLEEPKLELSRSVWRAIQLILSIIFDEDEWVRVVNEIQRKMVWDDLIVQNSISSPLSTNLSPTSMGKVKISKSFSGVNPEKVANTDSWRNTDSRQLNDERHNIDSVQVISIDRFIISYKDELLEGDKKYRHILPNRYNKISKAIIEDGANTMLGIFSYGRGGSILGSESNSLNKFIQIKYTGECDMMNSFLLPIINPIESNSYQKFLNCIIPFTVYSDILRDGSYNLKREYQKLDSQFRKGCVGEINLSGMDGFSNDEILPRPKMTKITIKELGRKIDDCHMYLNVCRYYFPKEVWDVTETAFSTIPKELDRIRNEAETQHLLFNRNIFGEMVNDSFESNDGLGILGQRSFLNKDVDITGIHTSSCCDSQGNRFLFSSYSPNSGIVSIHSFAKNALSRFNILWNASKSLDAVREDSIGSVKATTKSGDFTESESSKSKYYTKKSSFKTIKQSLDSSSSSNNIVEGELDKTDTQNMYSSSLNELIPDEATEKMTNDKDSPVHSKQISKENKLPETLEKQLNIKKMELISEYIKCPTTFKNLEQRREHNENITTIEGVSAILASTFIKYISTELFQHLYTSEVFMLMAYREISNTDSIISNGSGLDSDFQLEEHMKGANLSYFLENEELMVTIDKLLSLESLVAAICKQISTFVAQSQSPSRHRFAKALANLVYISFKP